MDRSKEDVLLNTERYVRDLKQQEEELTPNLRELLQIMESAKSISVQNPNMPGIRYISVLNNSHLQGEHIRAFKAAKIPEANAIPEGLRQSLMMHEKAVKAFSDELIRKAEEKNPKQKTIEEKLAIFNKVKSIEIERNDKETEETLRFINRDNDEMGELGIE